MNLKIIFFKKRWEIEVYERESMLSSTGSPPKCPQPPLAGAETQSEEL